MAALVGQSESLLAEFSLYQHKILTGGVDTHRNESQSTGSDHEGAADVDKMRHEQTTQDHRRCDIRGDLVCDRLVAAG
jgi:hypothetical protein